MLFQITMGCILNNESQNKKEEKSESVEPKVRNEKKYGLGAYKSKERFQVKEKGFQVKGTGTPAEEREEDGGAAEK